MLLQLPRSRVIRPEHNLLNLGPRRGIRRELKQPRSDGLRIRGTEDAGAEQKRLTQTDERAQDPVTHSVDGSVRGGRRDQRPLHRLRQRAEIRDEIHLARLRTVRPRTPGIQDLDEGARRFRDFLVRPQAHGKDEGLPRRPPALRQALAYGVKRSAPFVVGPAGN